MDVTTLQKALEQMRMERDAAIVAREDVLGQLRVSKRRLKEAEEEQYKAEEDAAVLRAEIQNLQQSDRGHDASFSYMPEHQEIAAVKSELEEMWTRLQQEQLKLATERQRNASLTARVKELEAAQQTSEAAFAAARNEQLVPQDDVASASITLPLEGAASVEDTATSTEVWTASEIRTENDRLKVEKTKHEGQLHELASMVERLEKGRQKLLREIDAQSLEIEKLFMENSNLELSIKETREMSAQWESQVRQCSEQNAQLRSELNRLRMEQAELVESRSGPNDNGLDSLRRENAKLKRQLAEVQALSEEQTAMVAELTASLNRAVLSANSLGRLYKPILSNIQHRLLQLKQDAPLNETSLFSELGVHY
ncbi:hypothetical protein R1sor_014681 [Riccia sorocarpa]|uniref:Uncharacterized protein n=1 Tax=Riccia sorocarpa TaxID=122646 RepID=A0ABD3HCP8_9MARC